MSDSSPIQRVRPAVPEDAATIAGLVTELRHYEGKEGACPAALVETWGFGSDPAFRVLIAEADGEAVGYLAFFRAFSFFKEGPVLLVENVYVRESQRGSGLGKQLLAEAARIALAEGFVRMELNVRIDNPHTIAFYEGMEMFHPGEIVYRLEDEGLEKLAART